MIFPTRDTAARFQNVAAQLQNPLVTHANNAGLTPVAQHKADGRLALLGYPEQYTAARQASWTDGGSASVYNNQARYQTRSSSNFKHDPTRSGAGPAGGGGEDGRAFPARPSGRNGAVEILNGKAVPYSGFAPNAYATVERLPDAVKKRCGWETEADYQKDERAIPCKICGQWHFTCHCVACHALSDAAVKNWGEARAKATWLKHMARQLLEDKQKVLMSMG
jgi:hypothetical protein